MPWGDYGDTLLTGFAYMEEGTLQIERVGSFVPPVYSCFNNLLVTDSFKRLLEDSELSGFSFIEANPKKVVNLNWTSWDLSAEEPRIYPSGGEPENYIYTRKHDSRLVEKMPRVWGLTLDDGTLVGRDESDRETGLYIIEDTWTGNDIFISKSTGYIYFTEKATEWFTKDSEGYACFRKAASRTASTEEIAAAIDYIKPKHREPKPFEDLTIEDWKRYQRHLQRAHQYMDKSAKAKTEKSRMFNGVKALMEFEQAEAIRRLSKKEMRVRDALAERLEK